MKIMGIVSRILDITYERKVILSRASFEYEKKKGIKVLLSFRVDEPMAPVLSNVEIDSFDLESRDCVS